MKRQEQAILDWIERNEGIANVRSYAFVSWFIAVIWRGKKSRSPILAQKRLSCILGEMYRKGLLKRVWIKQKRSHFFIYYC